MAAATPTYSGRSILFNRLKGNGTEPKNLCWGSGAPAGDAANGDVNLFSPLTEARVVGTSTLLTTTQLADTYQVVGTITAAGTRAVTEVGLFDTATALSPKTTVTGSLTNSETGSKVVAATTGFPGTGNFYCQLDNEVVVATVVDGTHLNLITRGVLGSTAATHLAGAVIVLGGDGGAGTGGATSAQTATVANTDGGNLFAHANFAVINLNLNDSITFTFKDQLT